MQTFFSTHRSVSTLDRVGPFQLTDEHFLHGTSLSRGDRRGDGGPHVARVALRVLAARGPRARAAVRRPARGKQGRVGGVRDLLGPARRANRRVRGGASGMLSLSTLLFDRTPLSTDRWDDPQCYHAFHRKCVLDYFHTASVSNSAAMTSTGDPDRVTLACPACKLPMGVRVCASPEKPTAAERSDDAVD